MNIIESSCTIPPKSPLCFLPNESPEKELWASCPDRGATGMISAKEFYEGSETSLSSENTDYSLLISGG